MENLIITRSFGEVLKEIVKQSSYSDEEFSDLVNQKIKNSSKDNIAPSISTLNAVVEVSNPEQNLEMELYRAIIPLMLLDEERPINEVIYACRKSQGISLIDIGKRLEDMIDEPYECEISIIVPLLELGYRRALDSEIEAIAKILHIEDIEILKKKARPKKGLQVVNNAFDVKILQLTDEKIDEARMFLESEKKLYTRNIVSAASEFLQKYKTLRNESENNN